MSPVTTLTLSPFATDVLEGFSHSEQKQLPPAYLYDELGSVLFEAITVLPEYGLTRADERLLSTHAGAIANYSGRAGLVAELGSGSGKKTRAILEALQDKQGSAIRYCPIDVSQSALVQCEKALDDLAQVTPICATWLEGVELLARQRNDGEPLLLLFLGSSIGNIARAEVPDFLKAIRAHLQPGDLFLLGADLLKPISTMITAYDDPTGVTAAFNLNLLGRMNRELGANFDLRSFQHEARWNAEHRRIEMHLVSLRSQTVRVNALERSFSFRSGETIWTESSHKFTASELEGYGAACGFTAVHAWVDTEWPFAEVLWEAATR